MPPAFWASAMACRASVVLPDDFRPVDLDHAAARQAADAKRDIERQASRSETVSTSIPVLLVPSRMIEPLPKARSICESAASSALDLSIEEPSTRRSASCRSHCRASPYDRDSEDRQTGNRPGAAPVWG